VKLLLTHVPQARQQYYGARALARLQELVEVVLHEGDAPLDPKGVIAAFRDADFIADRATPMPGEVFAALPTLKVVMRSAIDIRNIDVAAASKAGVLVTHAEAGFVKSVVELTLGLLVDLSRGISRASNDYRQGRLPEIKVGRQLAGSTVGIIGYGRISRDLAPVLAAMGMTVLVSDPYA
jgi:D-3-phosphoglycerate dehydrogenase